MTVHVLCALQTNYETVTSSNTIPPSSGSAGGDSGRARKMAWTNTTTTDAPEQGEREREEGGGGGGGGGDTRISRTPQKSVCKCTVASFPGSSFSQEYFEAGQTS